MRARVATVDRALCRSVSHYKGARVGSSAAAKVACERSCEQAKCYEYFDMKPVALRYRTEYKILVNIPHHEQVVENKVHAQATRRRLNYCDETRRPYQVSNVGESHPPRYNETIIVLVISWKASYLAPVGTRARDQPHTHPPVSC